MWFFILFFFGGGGGAYANSTDPDQTPQNAVPTCFYLQRVLLKTEYCNNYRNKRCLFFEASSDFQPLSYTEIIWLAIHLIQHYLELYMII